MEIGVRAERNVNVTPLPPGNIAGDFECDVIIVLYLETYFVMFLFSGLEDSSFSCMGFLEFNLEDAWCELRLFWWVCVSWGSMEYRVWSSEGYKVQSSRVTGLERRMWVWFHGN